MPTAYAYTSADTLLPTTHYQMPHPPPTGAPPACTSAVAAAAGSMTSRGRLLQAFTFCSSTSGARGSSSAPASPGGSRTLLYTRTATCSPLQDCYPQRQPPSMPAVDLLDRLTLLRRLAPATDPAARPRQLAPSPRQSPQRHAAPHHFTPAPAKPQAHTHPSCGQAAASPTGGACKRWAWDDSLVGGGGGGGSGAGRPIGAVPAPGWRYCGDVLAAAEVEGAGLSVAVTRGGDSSGNGTSDGALRLAVTSSERCGSAGGGTAGAGRQEVLVLVHSPRAHQLGTEEEQEDVPQGRDGMGGYGLSGSGAGRPAFRPPGPLQHKFGNKPRPKSAPSAAERAAERAAAAGLRGCGCPRSPRGATGTHVISGAAGSSWRRAASSPWRDEEREAAAPRPRSAAPAPALIGHCQDGAVGWRSSASGATEAGITGRGSESSMRRAGAGMDGTTGGGARTTHTVQVAAGEGTDVVVVSSPQAHCCGCCQDTPVVAASSPRRSGASGGGGSAGGTSSVTVVQQHKGQARHTTAPPAARQTADPRLSAGAAAPPAEPASQAVPHASGGLRDAPTTLAATKLSVSVPAGRGGSWSVRAGASSPTAGSSGVGSPIKAWRPQAGPAEAGAWSGAQRAALQPASPLRVDVDVALAPSAAGAGLAAVPAADLQLLSGEVRRREASFQQLLQELERITHKCSQLTSAAAATGGGGGGGAGASGRPGAGGPAGRCQQGQQAQRQQQAQRHTTHQFGAGCTRGAASGLAGTAGSERCRRPGAGPSSGLHADVAPAGGGGGGGGREGEEWSWESLLAFEESIRAQQRKVGGLRGGGWGGA